MGIRRNLFALTAAAAAAGASLVSIAPAHADARFVGGGAAAVQLLVDHQSNLAGRLSDRLGITQLPINLPSVELPDQGSPTTVSAELLPGLVISGVGVHAMKATTIGNLHGNPYAHSTASIAEVSIPGTAIRAISSECTWDNDGARATSAIVDANGTTYMPAPNTKVTIPNYGVLTLNYQHEATFNGADVISVYAARLELTQDTTKRYTNIDLGLAFSSCDPLAIPAIPVLKLSAINID